MRRSALLFAILLPLTACNNAAGPGSRGDGGHGGADGGVDGSIGPDPADCGVPITTSGALDIDIPAVTLSGRVTLDGAPLPSASSYPSLRLERSTGEGGALVSLDRLTADGMYQVQVIPGVYDVVYDAGLCDDSGTFPCQSGVHLKKAVSITSSGALDLDIPTVQLTGQVTLSGAPLPPVTDGDPSISLHGADQSTGVLARLGQLAGAPYHARLIAGTYDLLYSSGGISDCQSSPFPCQSGARLKKAVSVSASGALDVDIPTVHLTGQVTLNGQPLPPVSDGQPSISLRGADQSTGVLAELGQLSTGSYDVNLVAGTYDLLYSSGGISDCQGSPYPCQSGVALKKAVSITSSGALDLDIPTVHLTGRITMNGQPLPPVSDGDPSIGLRGADQSTGMLALLGQLTDGTYDVYLVAGSYDLLYSSGGISDCQGSLYPCQSDARLKQSVSVSASGALDVDIPTLHLTGRVTLNGGALPPVSDGDPSIALRGADQSTGMLALLGQLGQAGYDVYLIAGTYDLLYSSGGISDCQGSPYPCQSGALIRQKVGISSSGALDIDLPTIHLTGQITLNGAPPPASTDSRGELSLVGDGFSTGVLADLDQLGGNQYDVELFAGHYDVEYTHGGSCTGETYPCQTRILRGCTGSN